MVSVMLKGTNNAPAMLKVGSGLDRKTTLINSKRSVLLLPPETFEVRRPHILIL